MMEMLAGIHVTTRRPNSQAIIQCHAHPRGRKPSWGPKWADAKTKFAPLWNVPKF